MPPTKEEEIENLYPMLLLDTNIPRENRTGFIEKCGHTVTKGNKEAK